MVIADRTPEKKRVCQFVQYRLVPSRSGRRAPCPGKETNGARPRRTRGEARFRGAGRAAARRSAGGGRRRRRRAPRRKCSGTAPGSSPAGCRLRAAPRDAPPNAAAQTAAHAADRGQDEAGEQDRVRRPQVETDVVSSVSACRSCARIVRERDDECGADLRISSDFGEIETRNCLGKCARGGGRGGRLQPRRRVTRSSYRHVVGRPTDFGSFGASFTTDAVSSPH